MNSKHFHWLMIGLVGVLVLAGMLSIYWGDKALKQRANKLVSLKLDNQVLDQEQVSLAQATKDIKKYQDLEKIAKTIVPQDKDQAEAVREIVNIAADSNIKLSAISFPASTLGQTAPAPSTPGGTTPQVTTPPVTQVKPVDGIPGVYIMEINIQQDTNNPVSYASLINFLSKLEQNRRTAQVTSVTVQPNSKDRSLLTFNLIVDIYIKP